MDAIEFVSNYESYLDEISLVIKPDLEPVIIELKEIDPHDLVNPNSWFVNEREARGFVWSLFIRRARLFYSS